MSDPFAGVVLGIDTSTDVAVGVARAGVVLATRSLGDRRAHAEQLMPLVSECLIAAGLLLADLDAVAVGLGPGPYTGLRVGIVTAQALAFVRRVPLKGVCSLDVIALSHALADVEGEFVACSDARRKELYWARYAPTGERLEGPFVTLPDDLPPIVRVGLAADLFPSPAGAIATSLDAGVLAARAREFPDAGTEPLYLRRPDATVPTRRKSALPRISGRTA